MCKKILYVLAVLIGAYSVYLPSDSCAGALPSVTPQTPTCNADIMVSMHARSWLEAQREDLQNKNLIVKPDSVMEYSCFGSFLNELALEAQYMFSENRSAWDGSVGIITNSSLDEDLQALVGSSLSTYLSSNFGHDYLGGRWTGEDYSFSSVSGANYTCEEMNRVWMYSKCVDYGIRDEDNFRTFRQYAGYDPRTLPSPCSSIDPRISTYEQNVFATYGSAGAAPWRDEIGTYFENFYDYVNDLEGGACSTTDVIRTGLSYWDEGTTYDDGVCMNPACYYDAANSCIGL